MGQRYELADGLQLAIFQAVHRCACAGRPHQDLLSCDTMSARFQGHAQDTESLSAQVDALQLAVPGIRRAAVAQSG
jgi:hypothetical protein